MTTVVSAPRRTKSKTTAGILGILLGGLGVHKFYMGRIGQGILYLVFVWTYVPAIIGLIEGIWYLVMSEEDWQRRFFPAAGLTVVVAGGQGFGVYPAGSATVVAPPSMPVWQGPPAAAPSTRTCLGCGMGIQADFNVCPHCGKQAKIAMAGN